MREGSEDISCLGRATVCHFDDEFVPLSVGSIHQHHLLGVVQTERHYHLDNICVHILICVLIKSPVLLEMFNTESEEVKLFFVIGCIIGALLCMFCQIFVYIKVRSYLALRKATRVTGSPINTGFCF